MAPAGIRPTFFPMFTNGTYSVPYYGSDPFITGYELTIPTGTAWLSAGTKFTLKPGSARAFASDYVITYNPYLTPGLPELLNLDLNTTGPLGCFPVAFTYLNVNLQLEPLPVYVLGDSTGINPTTAIVSTGYNFLPPGYNQWRRVGTIVLNNISRQLTQITQSGTGNTREYTGQQFLTGAAYGPTVFFTIPLSGNDGLFSSPMVTDILTRMQFQPASVTDYAAISQYNVANNTALIPYLIADNNVASGGSILSETFWIPVGKGPRGNNIQYVTVVGAGALLGVQQCGWRESMGLQLV